MNSLCYAFHSNIINPSIIFAFQTARTFLLKIPFPPTSFFVNYVFRKLVLLKPIILLQHFPANVVIHARFIFGHWLDLLISTLPFWQEFFDLFFCFKFCNWCISVTFICTAACFGPSTLLWHTDAGNGPVQHDVEFIRLNANFFNAARFLLHFAFTGQLFNPLSFPPFVYLSCISTYNFRGLWIQERVACMILG